jgi:hypothetical protein
MNDTFAQALIVELSEIRKELAALNRNLQAGAPQTFGHELIRSLSQISEAIKQKK